LSKRFDYIAKLAAIARLTHATAGDGRLARRAGGAQMGSCRRRCLY
jgi:hypothetical protein